MTQTAELPPHEAVPDADTQPSTDEQIAALETEIADLQNVWRAIPRGTMSGVGGPSLSLDRLRCGIDINRKEIELHQLRLGRAEQVLAQAVTALDEHEITDSTAVAEARDKVAAARLSLFEAQRSEGRARLQASERKDAVRRAEEEVARLRGKVAAWSRTLEEDEQQLQLTEAPWRGHRPPTAVAI